MTRLTTLGLVVLFTAAGGAQAPATQQFEVASVKVNRSDAAMQALPALQQGGRVFAINVPLRELIRAAYGVRDNQVILASPLAEVRFDLEARAGANATREQAAAMLRGLLADRFGLKTHREIRQLPVYTLERVNAARLGAQLKPSGTECAPLDVSVRPRRATAAAPATGGVSGTPLGLSELWATCPSMFFPGGWSLRSMSMPAFAVALERLVRRPVIDETGIARCLRHRHHLRSGGIRDAVPRGRCRCCGWRPDRRPAGSAPPAQRTGPSLFTALQDQLGLRLEGGRAPVDVLVVDQVQPPTEN